MVTLLLDVLYDESIFKDKYIRRVMWNVPAGIERMQYYLAKNGIATDAIMSNISTHKHYWLIKDDKRVAHPHLKSGKTNGYDLVGLSIMAPELFQGSTKFQKYLDRYKGTITVAGGPGVWNYLDEIIEISQISFAVHKWGEEPLNALTRKVASNPSAFPLTENTFREAFDLVVPKGLVGKYIGESNPWTQDKDVVWEHKDLLTPKGELATHTIFYVKSDAHNSLANKVSFQSIPEDAFGYVQSKRKVLILDESLGCVNKCTFCWWSSSTGYYGRPVEDLLRDVKVAQAKEITVDSASFLHKYNLDRVSLFSDGSVDMVRRRIIPKFKIDYQARADGFVPDIMQKLVDMNTSVTYVGFEFGSQRLLKSTHKNTTMKQNIDAIDLSAEYGIPMHGFFILTTKDACIQDVKNTLALMLYGSKVHKYFFMSVNPFLIVTNGTPFYESDKRTIDITQASRRSEDTYGKKKRKLKEKEILRLDKKIIPDDKEAFRLAWNLDIEGAAKRVLSAHSLRTVIRKTNRWKHGLEDLLHLDTPRHIVDYLADNQ